MVEEETTGEKFKIELSPKTPNDRQLSYKKPGKYKKKQLNQLKTPRNQQKKLIPTISP